MAERNHLNFGGLWTGLSYIFLGLLAMGIFALYGESINTVEIISSIVFVGIGVATLLAPKISPRFAELNRYWTGLFWALCGLGILGLSLLSSRRWVSGVILGVGLVIYGILIIFDL